jgi:PIN domain nuclease of toxin-antitoxin system
MKYLLDTHVLLWALENEHKLSNKALRILRDPACSKVVSLASIWEIAIKNRIGKLPLNVDLSEINKTIEDYGCGIIGIDYGFILAYNKLPLIHRDPFDGMLIATAIKKSLTIITNDENIQKYDVSWVW